MKHLAHLKRPLNNSHGEPYEGEQSSGGYLLVEVLASMKQCTGVEKIDAYKLSIALRTVDEIDLEEAEIKLCEKAIFAENLPAHIHAQLLTVLQGEPLPEPPADPATNQPQDVKPE